MGGSRDSSDSSKEDKFTEDDLQQLKSLSSRLAEPHTKYMPVDNAIKEFYDVNARYFAEMHALAVTPKLKSFLTAKDVATLESLYRPLNSLKNPFTQSNPDIPYSIQFSMLAQQANSDAFKHAAAIMHEATLQTDRINLFILEIKKRKSIDGAKQIELYNEIEAQLPKPFQNLIRWGMVLETVRNNFAAKAFDTKGDDKIAAMVESIQKTDPKSRTEEQTSLLMIDALATNLKKLSLQANQAKTDFNEAYPELEKGRIVTSVIDALETHSKDPKIISILEAIEQKQNLDDKINFIGILYVNTYVDGRSKNRNDLINLEKLLVNAVNPEYDPNNPEQKMDEFIFVKFNEIPSLREKIVNNLFHRAMVEGVGGNNAQLYANCVKAIVRMGNDAIKEWNVLTIDKFGASILQLPLAEFDKKTGDYIRTKEKESIALFSLINKDENLKPKILETYYSPILLHSLAKIDRNDFTPEQAMQLDHFIQTYRDDTQKKPTHAHQQFINQFTELYITNRKKDGKDPVLSAVEDAFAEFHKVQKEDSAKVKDRIDALIFGTIRPEEKDMMAQKLLEHAEKNVLEGNKPEFVNTVKAIVRMELVSEWDKRVAANPQYEQLKLGKEMNESAIEKFFDKLPKSQREASPSISGSSTNLSGYKRTFFARKLDKLLSGSVNKSSVSKENESPKSPESPGSPGSPRSPASPDSSAPNKRGRGGSR